jgi:hypothetical protein
MQEIQIFCEIAAMAGAKLSHRIPLRPSLRTGLKLHADHLRFRELRGPAGGLTVRRGLPGHASPHHRCGRALRCHRPLADYSFGTVILRLFIANYCVI